ncbi:MAG: FAD-dependent oxidoreductase, partial [Catalinimonas sp.]
MRIAVIGGGISGVSVARMLHDRDHDVTLFEAHERLGGLVKCDRIEGNLYHRVGGHVFNTKTPVVQEWFWRHFDRDAEFLKARRNAKIYLDGRYVGYPIENHLYQLPEEKAGRILDELLAIHGESSLTPDDYPHFEAFLRGNFGATLYDLYFGPYNQKIWRFPLEQVAMAWLDGKLPMPDLPGILRANILRADEADMVHATFYYARTGGSQFIVDRLVEGVRVRTGTPVTRIERQEEGYRLNDTSTTYDQVIYCGDVRRLHDYYVNADADLRTALAAVRELRSNGTSNVLCETDETDLSWLYLPDPTLRAHRIIYTGNFSATNNGPGGRPTCVVEFSGQHSEADMYGELARLPGNLRPLSTNYEANSYVIQAPDTRDRIAAIKRLGEPEGLFLLGRFAEWEYYNMDKAIEAAIA